MDSGIGLTGKSDCFSCPGLYPHFLPVFTERDSMKTMAILIISMALMLQPVTATILDTGSIVSEGYYLLPSPPMLNNLVKVTAADDLNFGLRSDGKLILWGEDSLGLIDIVDPSATYLDVSLGYLHVMVLNTDGSIEAYSGPDTWFPLTPPEPNSGYIAVSAGSLHSLALRDDGSVESWGSNLPPVPVPNSGFTAIAAGSGTNYALRSDGSIAVWGSDNYGQHNVPLPNSGFVALSAGDYFALALRNDGSIAAWGRDNFGQLTLPIPNEGFSAVAAGSSHAMALREEGSVEAWGDNSQGQTDLPVPNNGFAHIAAGFYHSVGVRDNGEMIAWGRRNDGACGVYPPNENFIAIDNDLAIRPDGSLWLYLQGYAPPDVPVPNIGFVHVQRRGTWSLALRDDGSIAAWGDNYSNQLNVPAPNSGYVSFTSGSLHSVALRDDGSIEAWGDNWSGQCNIPDPSAEYIAVTAGSQHSAAVKADGSVSVWGYSTLGPPATETGYVAVAAGQYHTMALHEDGHIEVWSTWAPVLAVPEPNSGFVAIQAGGKTSVAMREDGTLVAWGFYTWESGPLFGGSTNIGSFSTNGSVVYAVESAPTSVAQPGLPAATDGIVLGALPNPFNPTLTVWFTSPADDRATIEVFDLRGRRVRDLWRGELTAGQRRSAVWDGRDDTGSRVASGTYLVKLQGERGGVAMRKVSLVK
jgi:alpha-tubulin suppressor-like RCC1 family protein